MQVDYELVVYDELPARAGHAGGQGGRSVLNEQLDKIKGDEKFHGKPIRIGLYQKGTAATAAKNVLQQRNGRTPAVRGWKFETRRVPKDRENPEAGTDMGLFAIFTPDQIVPGAEEAHVRAEEHRVAKNNEARTKAKAEEEAKVSAGNGAGKDEKTAPPAAATPPPKPAEKAAKAS